MMKRLIPLVFMAAVAAVSAAPAQAEEGAVIEATTAAGKRVQLLPDGRWAYIDEAAQADATSIPENCPYKQLRAESAPGGWFGTRSAKPGDDGDHPSTPNPNVR